MAESQVQKKNKKGKKKLETVISSPASLTEDTKIPVTVNSASNKQTFVDDDVNITTGSSEVSQTPGSQDKLEIESSNKKKKKSKKKAKEVLKETFPENNKPEALLNFSENGIQLVNHPEISVTITESSESKEDETKCITEKIPPFDDEKQTDSTVSAPNKKKKKKKKKSGDNAPAETTMPGDNSVPTPTYTKVVTSDSTCVLVVNNEKFSVDTKSLANTEGKQNKGSENMIDFSIPSEKQLGDVLLKQNFTSDTSIKFSNSVSIFPVLTDNNNSIKDPLTTVSVNQDSETVSHVVGTQINESALKENSEESKPTKSQLKAERRAKQEAQRAAKLAKTNAKADQPSKAGENKSNSPKEKTAVKESSKPVESAVENPPAKVAVEKEALHKMKLFSHLPQFKKFNIDENIHPAILEVGYQYNKGIISGSNARCVALLEALKEVIKDHTPHPDKDFCRDLESCIQTHLNFLNNCRPLSISMMSAVRFLKHQINHMQSTMEVDQIKDDLCCYINRFVKEDILLAKEAICNFGSFKIIDGDVILVYAYSSLVIDILCRAHREKKLFRVVVVDSRPKLEGLKMLRSLVKQGIHCSYTSINAISYIMKEVTKVYLGAHALLANGCVISRIGNKQIALVAMAYSIPVFVCSETYKFCERVLTDSFVHNELGDPEDIITSSLVSNNCLKNWHDLPSLQPLNLLYDLTTPDLIFEVITEKGALPCIAVPVLLRVRYAGLHD